MGLKRKLLIDDDYVHVPAKQTKTCPSVDMMDTDVVMSDSTSDAEDSPLSSYSHLPSSPNYPNFHLYPQTASTHFDDLSHRPSSPDKAVGLMQPAGFAHNNGNCTRIPKLRVSCESGPGGKRTMWSFCEDCGAVNLVE